MRITAASISDFKRIRHIAIRPTSDRAFVLIAGKNAQGKSSVLDALTVAFGGKRTQPIDPVRHGAKESEIIVELDGGEMIVRRVITPDGGSTLEVRGKDGPLKSPQAALDKLIGARFLDPIAFLQMQPKDQRATLLDLIDRDRKIAGLDERRARIFGFRTDVGRDLKKAQGEIARLPPIAEVPTAMTVKTLADERTNLGARQRAREATIAELDKATASVSDSESTRDGLVRSIASIKSTIAKLQAEQAELESGIVSVDRMIAERSKHRDEVSTRLEQVEYEWATKHEPRIRVLDADLARADEHNAAAFKADAANQRRRAAESAIAELEKQRDSQTVALDKIDEQKLAILRAAELPVEHLGVDEHGITLAGVPFAQASAAERVRVALAIAVASSPGLDDIWVRDGALLDEESLAAVVSHAAAGGKRLWIERVGTMDPGAIIISDGQVVT